MVDARKRSSGMVITLLVVAFASLAANQWHNRQSIEQAEILGATDLSSTAVASVLNSCVDQQRRSLMLSDVRDSIELIPFVRSATVYFSGVRGVTAEINERTPVAHVVLPDGGLRYVDAEGVILPKTARCLTHCVPVLRTSSMDQVPHLVSILMQAQLELNTQLYSSISELVHTSDGRVRVLTDHVTWHLGDTEAQAARRSFADMNVFWGRAMSGSSLARGAEIDLRWKHHVVIRNGREEDRS